MKILCIAPLTDDALAEVRALREDITVYTLSDLKRKPGIIREVEVVFGLLKPEQWAPATQLKWVQANSAGVERWLTPEARARNITITNLHIHGAPIAEHTFGLLLMLVRQLHVAYQQQQQRHWNRMVIEHVGALPGKTMGILGVGAIGIHLARVATAFEMRVIGLRRRQDPLPHIEALYTPEQKLEFLAACDVLVNLLPATPHTRGFLGTAEFTAMKPTALFINMGRGTTVDTRALTRALRAGKLAGAALDVTDPEPLPEGHALWGMPNVLITPHYAGNYPNYQRDATRVFIANLRRYLQGQPLENQVDSEAGY